MIARFRETAVEQKFLGQTAIETARGDFKTGLGKMLAVGIGKQAFLAPAARHDALACAEDVDGLRIHEAVLVE